MPRRLFAVVAMLVSAVALAAFVAIAVCVWFVSAEFNGRSQWALGEALAALDRARPVTKVIREALDAADAELKAAKPPAPADATAVQKVILRSAIKDSPDKVASARRAVDGLSDLLVVAHAALNSLQDLPGTDRAGLGDLEGLRQKLAASGAALQKANAVLQTQPDRKADAVAADDLIRIEAALADARVAVVEVEGKLDVTRSRVAAVRGQLPDWLNTATWATAALAVMGALGQVALIRWCLATRRIPAAPAPAR